MTEAPDNKTRRPVMWIEDTRRDLRYALRALGSNPAFTTMMAVAR